MKITQTNKCYLCPDCVDSLEHFFYDCKKIRIVSRMMSAAVDVQVNLTLNDVLVGILDKIKGNKDKIKCMYNVVLVGKMSVSIMKKTRL